jgi:signal peptidase
MPNRQVHARLPLEETISAHRAAPARRGFHLSLAEVRSVVRLTLLTAVGGLLLWALVPYAAGWHTTMVTSASMEPAVRTGDVVVIAPLDPETVRTGDLRGAVLQYQDPVRPERLMLHRVVSREGGALVTRGDNNADRDYAPVPPENVRGVARLRVPYAGLPMLWLQTRQAVPLGALALVILVLAWPDRSEPVGRPAGGPVAGGAPDGDIPVGAGNVSGS